MTQIFNSILELIYSISSTIFSEIANAIELSIPSKRNHEYNASFANLHSLLTKNGNGFNTSSHYKFRESDSAKHLICLASSGAGKSTNLCFPLLLCDEVSASSYIILDPSKELYNGTAAWVNENGFCVFLLDLDSNSQSSEGFNILNLITCHADIYRIASILVKNSQDNSVQDYWLQSAEQLIVFFIKYTNEYEEKQNRHLPHVLELLKLFSFSSKDLNKKILETSNEILINEFKSIISTPEKTLQCSISTAIVALRIYESPNIITLCQNHTIDFDTFFNKKCILYITCSDTYLYRSYTSGFFEMLFAYITKRPAYKYAMPLTILLDEAATMKISLSHALSVVRKQGVRIASFWQSYEQIESTYSRQEAATIYDNSNIKVFLPSNKSLAICTMLQNIFGRYSYTIPENPTQVKTRELATIQEIRETKKIIALVGVEKPILVEPLPFYMNKTMLKRSQLPLYQPPMKSIDSIKSITDSENNDEENK